MSNEERETLDRRQILTFAALSGLLAIPAAAEAAPPPAQPPEGKLGKMKPVDLYNPLLIEPHVCRGLNTCKGKGRDGKNECAGTGACATAPDNTCGGNNDCRGLGACDQPPQAGYPGENTCKGQGGCQVPMLPGKPLMWKKARMRFEALMEQVGRKVGQNAEIKRWLDSERRG